MLLEVLRKIWVWLYVRKIVRLWEVYGALTPSQHGFRKGHGTDSALMVHLNCFEHAKSNNTPLFFSSWDIRRAFDPGGEGGNGRQLVPPGSSAHWIAYLDDHGPTAVRSPWALEAWRSAGYQGLGPDISTVVRPGTFVRKWGTPQRDVSSPHAWTAFFDIALRALAMIPPSTSRCPPFAMPPRRSATSGTRTTLTHSPPHWRG